MDDLEIILQKLLNLNEDGLLKVKKEVERILNEAHDR